MCQKYAILMNLFNVIVLVSRKNDNEACYIKTGNLMNISHSEKRNRGISEQFREVVYLQFHSWKKSKGTTSCKQRHFDAKTYHLNLKF